MLSASTPRGRCSRETAPAPWPRLREGASVRGEPHVPATSDEAGRVRQGGQAAGAVDAEGADGARAVLEHVQEAAVPAHVEIERLRPGAEIARDATRREKRQRAVRRDR